MMIEVYDIRLNGIRYRYELYIEFSLMLLSSFERLSFRCNYN